MEKRDWVEEDVKENIVMLCCVFFGGIVFYVEGLGEGLIGIPRI